MTMVVALAGSFAWAQNEGKVEVSATAGWTFSDGVSGGTVTVAGEDFSRLDPKDSFSWNLRIGYMLTHNAEVGFLYGQQASNLEISGPVNKVDLGSWTLHNYHGYFAYNFGESEKVHPYVLLGLGATQFGSVDAVDGSLHRGIAGDTKFSTTWAIGVKVFPSPHVGIRLEGRWTPTYIKTDAAGWWCDPYWGCYTLGNAQYANQFEMAGGLAFRF
ncbi:MAG TPA: outer membrane beta-barrel protein [Vicinamibacteria bacterium]|nr:outer membrane beta-barrel protein [Vicinamibacteria bacterium]